MNRTKTINKTIVLDKHHFICHPDGRRSIIWSKKIWFDREDKSMSENRKLNSIKNICWLYNQHIIFFLFFQSLGIVFVVLEIAGGAENDDRNDYFFFSRSPLGLFLEDSIEWTNLGGWFLQSSSNDRELLLSSKMMVAMMIRMGWNN